MFKINLTEKKVYIKCLEEQQTTSKQQQRKRNKMKKLTKKQTIELSAGQRKCPDFLHREKKQNKSIIIYSMK